MREEVVTMLNILKLIDLTTLFHLRTEKSIHKITTFDVFRGKKCYRKVLKIYFFLLLKVCLVEKHASSIHSEIF